MSELALGMSIVFFLFTLFTFVIKPKLNEIYKRFTNSSEYNTTNHDFRFMKYKNASPPKDLPKFPEQNYNTYGSYYNTHYNPYAYNNYNPRRNNNIFTPTPNKNVNNNNQNVNKLNQGYNNMNLLKNSLDLTPNLNNISKNDQLTNNKITYTPSHLEDLQGKIKNTTRKYNINSGNLNSNLMNNNYNFNHNQHNNVLNSNRKSMETGIYSNLFGERRQLNFIGENKTNNILNFNTIKDREREYSLPNKGNINAFSKNYNNNTNMNMMNNTSNYQGHGNVSSIKNFDLSSISNLSNISKVSQNNKYVSKYNVDVSDIKRKII